MIDNIINSVMDRVVDIITLSFLSPFWWWLVVGIGVILLATAIGWFFPPLRSFSGAIVLAVIAALGGYRKAEWDMEEKREEELERERKRNERREDDHWWSYERREDDHWWWRG